MANRKNPRLSEKGFQSLLGWHLLCLTFIFRTMALRQTLSVLFFESTASSQEVLAQCKNYLFTFTKVALQEYTLQELPLGTSARFDITQASLTNDLSSSPSLFFRRRHFTALRHSRNSSHLFFLAHFANPLTSVFKKQFSH